MEGRQPVRLKDGNFYRKGRRRRLTMREVEIELQSLELAVEVASAAVIMANERTWWERIWGK